MRPTCEQSEQLIPLFGLAPGADKPFHQILRRPHHHCESSHESQAVPFLCLCRDSRLYRLHGVPVQSERGLSSAKTPKGIHRRPSTYAQQPHPRTTRGYKTYAQHNSIMRAINLHQRQVKFVARSIIISIDLHRQQVKFIVRAIVRPVGLWRSWSRMRKPVLFVIFINGLSLTSCIERSRR